MRGGLRRELVDEFGRDVPFTIEADVRFTGLRVVGTSGDDDDSLRDLLAAHFRLDGLSEQPCLEAETPAGSRRKMVE